MLLAGLLLVLPLRRAAAENQVDLKFYYYKEDGDRVQSWGPSFQWEMDLNAATTLKIHGVYDVISGATPTGEPLTQKTREVVVEVPVATSVVAVSGPSGSARSVSKTVSQQQTILVPYGPFFLPTATFNDQRLALDAEVSHREGDYLLTVGGAVSTEKDYNSLAASLKLARDFNNKNTTVSVGAGGAHDIVLNVADSRWDPKQTVEILAGLSQVIDARTLLTLNYVFRDQWGYLDDPYKFAKVGDAILPDHRPDRRQTHVFYTSLTRFIDWLNGSLEGNYRFSTDGFGIDAHTFGLTWHQKIGERLVVSPGIRYYEQSAARFYQVQFDTRPEFYSADYRLSKLATLSYGVNARWKLSDKVAVEGSYDRYSQWGRDGVTSNEAYPDANMFTLGIRLWY